MSFLFLTYGLTHSGKTSFGKRLCAALVGGPAKFIHVDNDTVDEFVRANFNNLRTDPEVLARRTPTDPDLRLLIPQLIVGYALREHYSAIATAAHPRRAIRQSYYKIARNHHAKVVLLTFNVSEDQIMQRIHDNNRIPRYLTLVRMAVTLFRSCTISRSQLWKSQPRQSWTPALKSMRSMTITPTRY